MTKVPPPPIPEHGQFSVTLFLVIEMTATPLVLFWAYFGPLVRPAFQDGHPLSAFLN